MESCSCIEGNPCADAYCCKDWKNREAVAARVRDEYAKFSRGVEHDQTLAKGMKQLGVGVRDLAAEQQLRAQEAREAEATGREAKALRAESVRSQPLGALTPNSDLNARLNGLDPSNPL